MTVYVAYNVEGTVIGIYLSEGEARLNADKENGHVEMWTVQ